VHARDVHLRLPNIELVLDLPILLGNRVEALHSDGAEGFSGRWVGGPVAENGVVACINQRSENEYPSENTSCDLDGSFQDCSRRLPLVAGHSAFTGAELA